MSPQRIQLRRTKGWRLPDGAVSVARPARWGNPFTVEQFGRQLAIELYRDTVHGLWSPGKLDFLNDDQYSTVYYTRQQWMKRIGGHPSEVATFELRGRSLACWCTPDLDCHASVLLELANPGWTP